MDARLLQMDNIALHWRDLEGLRQSRAEMDELIQLSQKTIEDSRDLLARLDALLAVMMP
jgi:hypothetical protein